MHVHCCDFKTRSFQKTRYKQRNTSITSISLSTTGRAELCLQTHRLAPALYCSPSVFFGLFTLFAGAAVTGCFIVIVLQHNYSNLHTASWTAGITLGC